MKTLNLFLLALLLSVSYGYAQKKGPAAASPAAGTAAASTTAGSGSSGSSSLIQGYHYNLPKRFHIAYRSVMYTSPNAVDSATGKRAANICYTYFLISTTNPFKPGDLPALDPILQGPSFKKLKDNFYAKIIGHGFLNNPNPPPPNMPRIVIDTLWRYSNKREHVSVTQSDTGKLLIQFYREKRLENDANKQASIAQTVKLLAVDETQRPAPTDPNVLVRTFSDKINNNEIDIKAYKYFTANAAIPLQPTDSAANFFLPIKSKGLRTAPLYYVSLPYSVWQYGATTIPFKYRFANPKLSVSLPNAAKTQTNYPVPAEATGNISLAVYIGRKYGATRFFSDPTKSHNTVAIMFSAFGGPTLVPLAANNIRAGSDINQFPSQLLALSYGGSCTVELGVLNLGLFGGIDQPLQGSPWVYAGHPWIGFGFGFNLGMLTSSGDIGLN